MVKNLAKTEKASIADAIELAERRTRAEIATVVARASDVYYAYRGFYGLFMSIIYIAALAANGKTIDASVFLLAFALAIGGTWVCGLFVGYIVPKPVLHHYAKRQAAYEYHRLSQLLPPQTPLVLLFISQSERYVQLIADRRLLGAIDSGAWNNAVNQFSSLVKKHGITKACVTTIQELANLLSPHFPERGQGHSLSNHIIEPAL